MSKSPFTPMSAPEFVNRVLQRADLGDHDPARTAVEATLETLAERITGGQADDLATKLPEELAGPLRAGRGPADEAESFDLEEFCRRVAQREGGSTTAAQARAHVAAVMRTLRDALPDEYDDVASQLPRTYAEVLPVAPGDDVRPPEQRLT